MFGNYTHKNSVIKKIYKLNISRFLYLINQIKLIYYDILIIFVSYQNKKQ